MKLVTILSITLLSLAYSSAYAGPYTEQCAMYEELAEQQGKDPYQLMRETGLGFMVGDCKKEDTSAVREKMKSGTLYCKSGSLCAKYDFEYPEDRKRYEPSCSIAPSCPSGYSDSCSVKNDKVRNGRGTVDWTLYAYGTSKEVWKDAKGVNCK